MKSISTVVLFTSGSRLFRFKHGEKNSKELSIFSSTLLHTLERCTFRSVRFLSLTFRAPQKRIRNCLRPGGNKKLRAMIRNRSSVQTRSTPPHVFSCLVVCLPRYFARRHTGNMRPMERTASVGEADPYARS